MMEMLKRFEEEQAAAEDGEDDTADDDELASKLEGLDLGTPDPLLLNARLLI